MYDFINIFVTKNTEHIGINSQMIYLNIYIYHLNYIELIFMNDLHTDSITR